MDSNVVEMSYNIFIASTVLIGIALILISSTWKTIKKERLKYPYLRPGRFFINTKARNLKMEASKLNCLAFGIALVGFSIFLTLVAITGIAFTMLDIHVGPFQAENYMKQSWF